VTFVARCDLFWSTLYGIRCLIWHSFLEPSWLCGRFSILIFRPNAGRWRAWMCLSLQRWVAAAV
jgi:hypothetical protein